jgi:acyl-CoA synthetase (AMP-forming)/AMP-acid ligase II
MREHGETLWERWLRNADTDPSREAIVHVRAGEEARRWSWGELVTAARACAASLTHAGVRRGDVCAMILRHTDLLYPLYLGVEALGAIPSILAYPNARLHPDKFVHGLTGMARRSGLEWVLTERALEASIKPLVTGEGSSVRGVLFPHEWDLAASAPSLEERPDEAAPCLLQHSSGTTGLQKAVMLSHRAVLDHVERYADAIGLTRDDKIASWLPLYHDMGLIAAFHLPLAKRVPTIQLDPFEWISAPYLLLEAISRERATVAWLPNFAYDFLADRVQDDELEGVRLESIRLLVNCSEPVQAASHAKFAERFRPLGLRDEALGASYAMAEATFAVTQTRPSARAREIQVARDALAAGRIEPRAEGLVRTCVSSGAPIRDAEVRVVDEAGSTLPEGSVGEIWVASVSLFDGYKNDPERTREVLADGWYRSGDYGFLFEGEIYVTGRKKDLIIVAGKNLYPEDIEDALKAVPEIIPGRVVAFGVEDGETGTEAVWVVCETEVTDEAARQKLERAAITAAMAIDVTVSKVLLAPPRWLVKSSSGKLSRKTNKERALAAELPFVARSQ